MNYQKSQDLKTTSDSATRPFALKEYLTLRLGSELYGISVDAVKEILSYQPVTPLTDAPPFILGLFNLRGDIVPVADLRIKFGVGEAIYDEFTIIVMLQIDNRIVGLVVDEVCDVVPIDIDNIHQAPKVNTNINAEFLHGLTKYEDEMVILINIFQLIRSDEMALHAPQYVNME